MILTVGIEVRSIPRAGCDFSSSAFSFCLVFIRGTKMNRKSVNKKHIVLNDVNRCTIVLNMAPN